MSFWTIYDGYYDYYAIPENGYNIEYEECQEGSLIRYVD